MKYHVKIFTYFFTLTVFDDVGQLRTQCGISVGRERKGSFSQSYVWDNSVPRCRVSGRNLARPPDEHLYPPEKRRGIFIGRSRNAGVQRMGPPATAQFPHHCAEALGFHWVHRENRPLQVSHPLFKQRLGHLAGPPPER